MLRYGARRRYCLVVSVLACASIALIAHIDLVRAAQVTSSSAQTPDGSEERYPHLFDITAATKIKFEHVSSPEQKYIVESMSGGVALLDFDRDGWVDIYITGAPSGDMAREGKLARSALYRNNHDGTFTDVTDAAGVATPCWAQGVAV